MLQKTLLKALPVVLAATTVLAGVTHAQELRLAPGTPPPHPGHTPLFTSFQEQINQATHGDLTGRILGLEIVNLGKMRTAMRSGLADVGMFLPAYFPADLPEVSLVGNLSFLGTNSQAMGAAMTEYIVNCDECQTELKKLGIVYSSSHSSDTYQLLTTKPVRNLSDLKGMRLRAGGPQFSRWAETVGAVGASVSVTETFESISQGVLEGTIASTADLISFRLNDVVKYITHIKLGTYHSTISHGINVKTWAGLSKEHRRVLMESSSYSSALATQRWAHEMPSAAVKLAQESGIEFIEPSQDLIDITRKFASEDLATVIKNAESRDGIKNTKTKVETFKALVKKWTAYAESVDNNPKKIADEVNRQVWDKVNFSRYGL